MKKSIRKIFVLILIITAVITSIAPSLTVNAVNMPYVIYETKNSEHLGSGILYENIKKFTSSGWWHINAIRVDLTNEYAEIGGLFSSKGLSNRDSVSKMVTDSKAVAGINGDFFNLNPIASSLGTLIDKGNVISLPTIPTEVNPALPTFYINSYNEGQIDFFNRSVILKSLNSNAEQIIHIVNKSVGYNAVTLLNKHWGSQSIGNKFHNDAVEMVVVEDIVQEIRTGQGPTSIPDNGYVIAANGPYKDNLLNSFNVGDVVKLDIGTTPNLENIKFAIGGGSVILKDGIITNSNINIKGDHPRTGIGITRDGKELIIATIDGRDSSYKGVSQEMFGAILKDLGAYNAINMDGGGSTTMAVRPLDEQVAKVVNKPSDGGERKVVNGVGVFSNAPKGTLSYLRINTDETKMFPNTTRRFTLKGYDEYHNPVEIDQNMVRYSFEGVDGEIDGNAFKPKSTGNTTITANYQGITSTINIKVLDKIESIVLPINKFHLNYNSQRNIGTVYGKDKNGFSAKIYPEDIQWVVTGDIGYIENGVFYSGNKTGTGAITAHVDNRINNILVSVGSSDGVLIEGFENIENFDFTTYPEYVVGEIGLSQISMEGNNSISLKYDFNQGEDTRASYLLFTPEGENGLALEGTPNKLSLWVKGGNNGAWLRGLIRDKNGKNHTVEFTKSLNPTEWQYVEANIPSNVAYPIVLERIYIVEVDGTKKYAGEILLDNLMTYYPPSYDNIEVPTPSSLIDNKNVKAEKEEKGYSFIVTRVPNNIQEIAGQAAMDKIRNKANSHNLSILIGKTQEELNKTIKSHRIINIGSPYITHRYNNLMVIDASSANGGIRPTNPQQWLWLKNGLANAVEDHIILFLNTPIYGAGGFTDKLEAELLHDTLVETSEKGKSLWVVYSGNTTKTDLKDGIRYIELNNKNIETPEDINNINSIEFVVNGKNITYQITN